MTLKLKPRKLVSINYSFLITLPKVWLDFHEFNPHDKVALEITDDEQGRALILRPLQSQEKKQSSDEGNI